MPYQRLVLPRLPTSAEVGGVTGLGATLIGVRVTPISGFGACDPEPAPEDGYWGPYTGASGAGGGGEAVVVVGRADWSIRVHRWWTSVARCWAPAPSTECSSALPVRGCAGAGDECQHHQHGDNGQQHDQAAFGAIPRHGAALKVSESAGEPGRRSRNGLA